MFMSSILFEVFKTVFAASCAAGVFVFGQAVVRFVIEPIVELRKLVWQIRYDFIFYGPAFHSPSSVPPEDWEKATSTYRSHAVSLLAFPGLTLGIPFYDSVAEYFSLPCRQQAREASPSFFAISNTSLNPSFDDFEFNRGHFKTIRRLLNLPEA